MALDPMVEIRISFFLECDELLESLQDALSAMDEGAQDNETINAVFRAVHSIKGGAGAFGLTALVDFAHRYETVLDALRTGRLMVTPNVMKLFFRAADLLQDQVRAARECRPAPDGAEPLLHDLELLVGGIAPAPPEPEVAFTPTPLSLNFADLPTPPTPPDWIIRFRPAATLYASGNEPMHLLRALAELGRTEVACDRAALPTLAGLDPEAAYLGWTIRLTGTATEANVREVFDFVEDLCTLEITQSTGADAPAPRNQILSPRLPARAGHPPPQPEVKNAPAEPTPATVRVDLDRIDRLVNLVGELVINQAMLAQSLTEAGLPQNSAGMTGLDAVMMLTRDIQDSVMLIRAQPVRPLFQRMARIVREASAALGKRVRLKTEGEATEIDKTVIERLADPLTHMIRNAVDHGLERPEARLAAGKADEGVITLSAHHRGGRVVIELSDDGAGINRARVRETAIARGLVAADAVLADSEIDSLLFLPGFSTATQISALSGRGVGMDVVRGAIQSLGGGISISSTPGLGTKLSISLPLTLAVLDGMVVRVAGETLVVPLSSILEAATVTDAEIRALGPQTNVIHLRGAFVPLYDLGVELGYRTARASYDGAIVLLTTQQDGKCSALIVDAILEQRQVVIKGLQHSCGPIPGVAAATILGDGRIALILDPADLVQAATGRTRAPDLARTG